MNEAGLHGGVFVSVLKVQFVRFITGQMTFKSHQVGLKVYIGLL